MDLLSQENIDQFRSAIRDLTDTFHKSPVTLQRESGGEVDLLAGLKPSGTGSSADGEEHGELYVQDDRKETVERYVVGFNRDYLAEKELIDPDTDELLISIEDRLEIKGKRFSIVKLTDHALFRGVPLLVQMVVAR